MEMDTLRKVRVIQGVPMVYYNHKRRRTGDVFQLIDREITDKETKAATVMLAEDQFSEKTMEWVSDSTPLSISIGTTARTGVKLIDQEEVQDARAPAAFSQVKRGKVTRPGRKEETGKPRAKTATSKKLAGKGKKKGKNLNPNQTAKTA